MSLWLTMPPETERTPEAALRLIHDRARRGDADAAAALSSSIRGAGGAWSGGIVQAPWCDGALYLLNPRAGVPAQGPRP